MYIPNGKYPDPKIQTKILRSATRALASTDATRADPTPIQLYNLLRRERELPPACIRVSSQNPIDTSESHLALARAYLDPTAPTEVAAED